MKNFYLTAILLTATASYGQTNKTVEKINARHDSIMKLDENQIIDNRTTPTKYYSNDGSGWDATKSAFADQSIMTYNLTSSEQDLLRKNHFVVTERVQHTTFCNALYDIYVKDLPLMITSDAVLNALHSSYDITLQDVENNILKNNIMTITSQMYSAFPKLQERYADKNDMKLYLKDVDLFVTVAQSLITETTAASQADNASNIELTLKNIVDSKMVDQNLYMYSPRKVDYSQFTPRGHYVNTIGSRYNLTPYFKTMMWFGFIEFVLTKPANDDSYSQADVDRMLIDVCLINELIEMANCQSQLNNMDDILKRLVGDCDNLTPNELTVNLNKCTITNASALLDSTTRAALRSSLLNDSSSQQKILSNIIALAPSNSKSMTFPIAYKVIGQRFILDSYIFQNLIYGRINAMRLMPDALDVIYSIGNNNALPLLSNQLQTYRYLNDLEKIRCDIDNYDSTYWKTAMYNVWLQSIRSINPQADTSGYPFFMKSVAWQHEKMNTQLASWTQLRHDNLLYAKQSYTPGVATCDYPHIYVEPYPALYSGLAQFAHSIAPLSNSYFWDKFALTMTSLEKIAKKELTHEEFTNSDIDFLKGCFKLVNTSGGYGGSYTELKKTGWYPDLYLDQTKCEESDYLVVDVHTQTTDSAGDIVGRVLHFGVGKINTGIFVAPSPSNKYKMTAYVGPVFSFYKTTTEQFNRLTDQIWSSDITAGKTPKRPDWTDVYMANTQGETQPTEHCLKGDVWTQVSENFSDIVSVDASLEGILILPQLFNPTIDIHAYMQKSDVLQISMSDNEGRTLIQRKYVANLGQNNFSISYESLSPGLYICSVQTSDGKIISKKIYKRG